MKLALLAPVLIMMAVSRVQADPGLALNWNDCPLSPSSQRGLIAACQNSGSEELIASFELSAPLDSVIALEAVVDVQSAASTLPPWWQYGPAGCRQQQLIASATFPGLTACADFWQNSATYSGPPVYLPGAPHGGTNTARIVISVAVLSSEARALAQGTRYYAARLTFLNSPDATCPGCETPACLVLNSIRLVRIPGTATGDLELTIPASAGANEATWQSVTATCDQVPVRRISWGRIKMLYR